MYVVISAPRLDSATLHFLTDDGEIDVDQPAGHYAGDDLAEAVEALEDESPRWVWADTAPRYGWLLAHAIRVEKCHDLRLTRAILRSSSLTADTSLARAAASPFDDTAPLVFAGSPGAALLLANARPTSSALFEAADPAADDADAAGGDVWGDDAGGDDADALRAAAAADPTVAEFRLQLDAIRTSTEPNRLRLLIAAESAGALIAAEMSHAGLPWRESVHGELLVELLGPRVPAGQRPVRLEQLAGAIRAALRAPELNPDSPADVLRALRAAGLQVATTRSYELQGIEHPVIAPLLEYKKLARLATANGWSWMTSWVRDGRFFPDYVPGGVVSGRWATRGGGALQLPKQVRRAVMADDEWMLVVADAAQLEPRILAGISGDTVMAAAGRGRDLYAGIVDAGAVETRAQAKVAMLGAMYGATQGESGRLLPRLTRAFPTALRFVEDAARAGERGEVVTSRLGRSAPRPGEQWLELQARLREGAASEREQQLARQQARDWGRFTRNFVVQASAADWALCWMADLRRRLAALAPAPLELPAPAPAAAAEHRAPDAAELRAAAAADVSAGADAGSHVSPTADPTTAQPAAISATRAASADPVAGYADHEATSAAAAAAGLDPTRAEAHPAAIATPLDSTRAEAGPADPATVADPLAVAELVEHPDLALSAGVAIDPAVAEAAALQLEAARRQTIEAEIAERERRKAAPSPFKSAADPVAEMLARLQEVQTEGRSLRPVAANAAPAARTTTLAPVAPTTTTTTAAATTTTEPPVPTRSAASPSHQADAPTSPQTPSPASPQTPSPASHPAAPGQLRSRVTAADGTGSGATSADGTGTSVTAANGIRPNAAGLNATGPAAARAHATERDAATRAAAGPHVVPGRAADPFSRAPHLVFFLHDEVIVHTPAALADEVAEAIRASAAAATRLLFGSFPLDVPLDVSIVASYADAV